MARKADRISLWILLVGALVAAAGILVSAIMSIGGDLATGTAVLHHAIDTPVPGAFPDFDGDYVATFTGMEISTTGLPSDIVIWLAVASGSMALAYLLVALSVAYLGLRLLRGDPFRRSLTLATLTASIALMVGWGLNTLITFIATMFGLAELVGVGFMSPGTPFTYAFDPGPFVIGIVLGVVATAFQYGERLQADTAGLV